MIFYILPNAFYVKIPEIFKQIILEETIMSSIMTKAEEYVTGATENADV